MTKLTQEQLLSQFCLAHPMAGVALRFQNVYGPGQSLKNPYTGILSIFSSLAEAGRTIPIYEDGRDLKLAERAVATGGDLWNLIGNGGLHLTVGDLYRWADEETKKGEKVAGVRFDDL